METNATIVTPVTVTPVNQPNPELQQTIQETAQTIEDVVNSFSDQAPDCNCNEDVKKAQNIFSQFTEYIKGDNFKNCINESAKKYGVPPKKLAQNFFEKVLGTIGDIAGIAVNTVGAGAHTVINLLSTILHGAVNIIVNVANALVSIVTLNKTCVA